MDYDLNDYWIASKGDKKVRANTAVEATRLFLAQHKSRSFSVRRYLNGSHTVVFDMRQRTMTSPGHHEFKSRAEAQAFISQQDA